MVDFQDHCQRYRVPACDIEGDGLDRSRVASAKGMLARGDTVAYISSCLGVSPAWVTSVAGRDDFASISPAPHEKLPQPQSDWSAPQAPSLDSLIETAWARYGEVLGALTTLSDAISAVENATRSRTF